MKLPQDIRLPQDRILHICTEYKDGKMNIVAEWQGEIVRCKDCKNRGKYALCDCFGESGFCSYGEPREDGE